MKSNSIKTPFGRLVAGICIGSFGQVLALIVPTALLLTIKLAMLDPANVTRNFSLVALMGAPAAIIGQYLAGYGVPTWFMNKRKKQGNVRRKTT